MAPSDSDGQDRVRGEHKRHNEDRDRRKRHRDEDGSRDSPKESRSHRRSRSPRPDRRSSRERHRHRDRRDRDPDSKDERHRGKRSRDSDGAKGDRSRSDGDKQVVAPLRRTGPLPSQEQSFAVSNGQAPEPEVERPNFGNTGLLAAASNTVTAADGTAVTLKYNEPPEARKPPARDQWRLFVFKGDDIVDTTDISGRSCWLVGREAAVADLAAEHPTVSKQHAVIQFRYTEKTNQFGDKIGRVKPYLIDLESANGTKLNGNKVPESRYLELRDKDLIQFGQSTRDYVLMLAPRE